MVSRISGISGLEWGSLMGFLDWFFGKGSNAGGHRSVAELAERLGLSEAEVRAVRTAYREFSVPKRSGGSVRRILAPDESLKKLQRTVLRRQIARLPVHPAVHGFEEGSNICTNAMPHLRKDIVIKLDIQDFFTNTTAQRVDDYFRRIGWNKEAAELLTTICTYEGALPQGAPTGPRLSNLVNTLMDARLAGLARMYQADYTRYADDITFSIEDDLPGDARSIYREASRIVAAFGYRLHKKRKRKFLRPHQQQIVTGLIVNNDRIRVPRTTRRWLRAVEHQLRTRGRASLTPAQLAGWRAFQNMIDQEYEEDVDL